MDVLSADMSVCCCLYSLDIAVCILLVIGLFCFKIL